MVIQISAEGWGVACLACLKPWVQSLAPNKLSGVSSTWEVEVKVIFGDTVS